MSASQATRLQELARQLERLAQITAALKADMSPEDTAKRRDVAKRIRIIQSELDELWGEI